MFSVHSRAAAFAVALVLAGAAFAAEPVRQIGIFVTPYYESARQPGEAPRVAVGKTYDTLLASSRREDILAARDLINAKPALVTPMTMMVLAIRLYDVGERDEAVFWFYAAKERAIVMEEVLDMNARGLAQAGEAVRSFATLAGPVINGYAFCDLARQQAQHARAIAWVEGHPYEVMFMDKLPARPGDRAANHKKAIADARERAAKEKAYFDDAKTRESYYATRKRNEADVRFCWK